VYICHDATIPVLTESFRLTNHTSHNPVRFYRLVAHSIRHRQGFWPDSRPYSRRAARMLHNA